MKQPTFNGKELLPLSVMVSDCFYSVLSFACALA